MVKLAIYQLTFGNLKKNEEKRPSEYKGTGYIVFSIKNDYFSATT